MTSVSEGGWSQVTGLSGGARCTHGLHSLDSKLYRFQPKEKKKYKETIKVIIWVNQIQVFLQAPKVF